MDASVHHQAECEALSGRVKVRARPNQHYTRHGTKSYVHLLNRFGFSPTKPGPYARVTTMHQRGLANSSVAIGGRVRFDSRLVKTVAEAEDGQQTVHLTPDDQQNEAEYLCQVSMGTPAQDLLVDFDTSSSHFWIKSTELDSAAQENHVVFDPSKSETFQKLEHQAWKISYVDHSSASGECGSDNVTIGGLTLRGQTVELASKLTGHFARGSGDGCLGLGFPVMSKAQTPVASIIKTTTQSNMPKDSQLFTSALCGKDRRGVESDESFYTFGHIEEDLVSASGQGIAWTDIDPSQGFWMFASTSVSVAGKELQLDGGNKAIADTGTPLVLVSDEVCEALYDKIPGARYDEARQGYVFPLPAQAKKLPEFKVAVGDTQFVLDAENLAFSLDHDDKHWYGAVQSRGSNSFDILGGAFLKSVYAIWDQGNQRFGLVPKIAGA